MIKRTRARRTAAVGMTALLLVALLSGLLPMRAGAASYTVLPVDGVFFADVNGTQTQVYAVSAAGGSYAWTVQSATAGGDNYLDSSGNCYAPEGASVTAVLTYGAVLLPTEAVAVTDVGEASSALTADVPAYPSDSESDLTCTFTMGAGAASLSVTSAFVQADAAPVNGTATAGGQKYAFNGNFYVPAITISFTASPYFTVSGMADTMPTAPFVVPPGMTTVPFALNLNTTGYTFPSDLSTLITGYSINGSDLTSTDMVPRPDGNTFYGEIPADFLNADSTVTITLDASQITPVSTGEENYGESDPEPEKKIRVENELDQTEIRSDTTLWPEGTVEKDGVSVTTVTDEELQALLDLAAKHAADTEALGGNGLREGIICVENQTDNSQIHTYLLELTDQQFEKLSQFDWDRLTMLTPIGSFSLYPGTIRQTDELSLTGSGGVEMSVERLDYEGRPGLNATLVVNRSEVTVLDEAYGVRVFIPYTPAAGEDINALIIEYIHEDGTSEIVTECSYDAEQGGLICFVSHLSKFGIAYRPAAFTDVGPDQWANPYVTFLVSRGIVSGGKDGKYRPDDAATRGEFLTVVSRALSAAKLPVSAVRTYSDVSAASSLARAANWIYYNNLASAITSGGKLEPNRAITRQDMALLVSNVAQGMGLRVRSKGLDTDYTDAGQIADYAKGAVTRLRAAGILEMAENYKFSPAATLNRGEMAQVVAALLSNL